jgi:hypothetical protein
MGGCRLSEPKAVSGETRGLAFFVHLRVYTHIPQFD